MKKLKKQSVAQVEHQERWAMLKPLVVSEKDRLSAAHVLYKAAADVLEVLFISTYWAAPNKSGEYEYTIKTKKIREKTGARSYRRQQEVLNEFQRDGIVKWKVIPAGRRDPMNKRQKIWQRQEGIEFTLDLQPLLHRVEEVEARRAVLRAEKAERTKAARYAKAEYMRAYRVQQEEPQEFARFVNQYFETLAAENECRAAVAA